MFSRAPLIPFFIVVAAGILLAGPELPEAGLVKVDRPTWIIGRVFKRPSSREGQLSLLVNLGAARARIRCPDPGRAATLPREGSTIRFFTTLRRPTAFQNPGSFDYRRYLAIRGASLTGRLKSFRLIELRHQPRPGPSERIRLGLERSILRRFEPGTPGALLLACLTGERRWVSEGQRKTLQRSGLGHLLAISGLHLGLLGLMLAALLALARVTLRRRRMLLVLFFLGFHQLCGGTPSITRATLMATVFLAGGLMGFHARPLNSLAAAGLLVLIRNPLMIHDVGFQLSFGATASILCLASPLYDLLRGSGGRASASWRSLTGMMAVSLAVILGTSPLQAALFNRASPTTVMTNLAAGPLLALALGAGILMLAAESLGLTWLAEPAALIVDGGFRAILWLGDVSAPFSFRLPGPGAPVCCVYYILLSGAFCFRRRKTVSVVLLAAAPALLLGSAALQSGVLSSGLLRVTFLDVGQGDAAVIRFPDGRSLVLDGGGALPGGFDFGERVVSPALWSMGSGRLDTVFLTHGHQDHAGGLSAVVRNFRPRDVLAGRHLRRTMPAVSRLLDTGVSIRALHRGQVIRRGPVELLALHPPPPSVPPLPGLGPNDDSLVLLVRYGRVKMLFTGDLGAAGEEQVLKSPLAVLARDCELLKVGHHGAAGGTTERFLDLVRPRMAVITAGRFNRFGHPHQAVLRRLADCGCRQVHRTGLHGALTVVSDGKRLFRSGIPAGREE